MATVFTPPAEALVGNLNNKLLCGYNFIPYETLEAMEVCLVFLLYIYYIYTYTYTYTYIYIYIYIYILYIYIYIYIS